MTRQAFMLLSQKTQLSTFSVSHFVAVSRQSVNFPTRNAHHATRTTCGLLLRGVHHFRSVRHVGLSLDLVRHFGLFNVVEVFQEPVALDIEIRKQPVEPVRDPPRRFTKYGHEGRN